MKNKRVNKIIAILAILTLTLCLNVQVFADNIEIGNFEVESNDTYEDANIINIDTAINGMISPDSDQDHYIFAGRGSTYNLLFIRQASDAAQYVVMIYDHQSNIYVMPLTEVDSSGILTYSFEPEWGHIYELVVGAYGQSDEMYQFMVY